MDGVPGLSFIGLERAVCSSTSKVKQHGPPTGTTAIPGFRSRGRVRPLGHRTPRRPEPYRLTSAILLLMLSDWKPLKIPVALDEDPQKQFRSTKNLHKPTLGDFIRGCGWS